MMDKNDDVSSNSSILVITIMIISDSRSCQTVLRHFQICQIILYFADKFLVIVMINLTRMK